MKGLSRCAFRFLRLRIKNINSRSKISPPDTPPMIAALGDFLLVDPWLEVELDEVPMGTLLEEPVAVRVVVPPVEDAVRVVVPLVEDAVRVVVPPPVEDVEGDGAS